MSDANRDIILEISAISGKMEVAWMWEWILWAGCKVLLSLVVVMVWTLQTSWLVHVEICHQTKKLYLWYIYLVYEDWRLWTAFCYCHEAGDLCCIFIVIRRFLSISRVSRSLGSACLVCVCFYVVVCSETGDNQSPIRKYHEIRDSVWTGLWTNVQTKEGSPIQTYLSHLHF